MKHSQNKAQLAGYIETHQEDFQALDEDAYDVICAITKTRELEQVKTNYQREDGGIDMCKAITDMIGDSRREGLDQGLECGLEQGTNRMGMLLEQLIAENRMDDIKKIASDSGFRNELFKEYNL